MALPVSVVIPDFEMTVGDSEPSLQMTLEDDNGPYDLTNKTVRARVTRQGTLLFAERECVLPGGTGVVRIDWEPTDFTSEGNTQVRFIVTDLDGHERTFPSSDFYEFPVHPR